MNKNSFINWNCCCPNLIQESNRQHCQIPWNLFLGLYWAFFQFSCWRQVQYKLTVVNVEFMQLFYINNTYYYWQESGWKLKNVHFNNKYYLIWQNKLVWIYSPSNKIFIWTLCIGNNIFLFWIYIGEKAKS